MSASSSSTVAQTKKTEKRRRQTVSEQTLPGKRVDSRKKLQQAASMQPQLPNWRYIGNVRKKYKFVRKIGSGSNTLVYLVQNRDDKKFYALKILENPQEWNNNEWLMLERLRESTDCLSSGVICHRGHFIIDNESKRGPHDRLPALLTDYVDGPDLFDFTRVWWESEQKHPSPGLARALVKSCIAALAVVHSVGIAHRDIKPENIVVQYERSDGKDNGTHNVRCTIIDFAYACDDQTCATARFSGTPCYASASRLQSALREQENTEPDSLTLEREQAGDVWALGLALYFFLTGSQPWPCVVSNALQEAKTPMKYSIAALAKFAERYSLLDHERVAGSDRDLENVIFQMLEPEDEMRLTAAAALAALQ